MLWGYNDTLFKLAKDVMPAEHVLPHDQFGLLVGVSFLLFHQTVGDVLMTRHFLSLRSWCVEQKNETSDGVFTVYTGKESMVNYAAITNWNGMTKLSHWKTDACNSIHGTDGTAFAPDLTPNTTLHLFNPDLCRALPLVYHMTVVRNGIEGNERVKVSRVTTDELKCMVVNQVIDSVPQPIFSTRWIRSRRTNVSAWPGHHATNRVCSIWVPVNSGPLCRCPGPTSFMATRSSWKPSKV